MHGTITFDGPPVDALLRQRSCDFALTKLDSKMVEALNTAEIGDGLQPASDWRPGLDIICMTDVQAKQVEWLWNGRFALGKVSVVAGNGGLGKSTILCDLAARTSTGADWPDGSANSCKGSVLILAAEDAADDTIKPRLAAAGADMSKVFSISAVRESENGIRRSFNLQADLARLEKEIQKIGDVRLVIVDPVSSYLGKVDSHKNADVRSVLEPAGRLAERRKVALVFNNHFSKGAGDANSRVIGSVAFVNQARAAFIVTPDADDETRLLFIPSKMNIAARGEGLAYRIGGYVAKVDGVEISTSQICWESSPVSMSADAALAAIADEKNGSALDDAAAFLQVTLADGPVAANEVKRLANEAGVAWATIRRAKAGIVEIKPGPVGTKDRWKWHLTPKALIKPQDAHEKDVSTLVPDEHLATENPPSETPDPADDWQFNREDDPIP